MWHIPSTEFISMTTVRTTRKTNNLNIFSINFQNENQLNTNFNCQLSENVDCLVVRTMNVVQLYDLSKDRRRFYTNRSIAQRIADIVQEFSSFTTCFWCTQILTDINHIDPDLLRNSRSK